MARIFGPRGSQSRSGPVERDTPSNFPPGPVIIAGSISISMAILGRHDNAQYTCLEVAGILRVRITFLDISARSIARAVRWTDHGHLN